MADAAASSGGMRRGRYGTKSGPRHLLQNKKRKKANDKEHSQDTHMVAYVHTAVGKRGKREARARGRGGGGGKPN